MQRCPAAICFCCSADLRAASRRPRLVRRRRRTLRAPTRADILRGEYGRYRANNDLLYYDLDIRVNPEKKFISGKNTIRFKMLKDDTRIQLELFSNYTIEKIVMGSQTLKYERDHNTVYVDFPETLRSGRTYSIEFHYSGQPREEGRFGALAFRTDPAGKHWINTANEGEGSASWWPSKDQWRDEPEGADIRVAVPNGLTNVSNGRFMGKTDLGDGYTRWDYRVHYPINSYNVSLNIAEYTHFSEMHGDLTMDYFVLPGNLEKAKVQFAQAKPMIEAFEKYVGKYPFPKDGFKLIEVPYSGMEHQSAVTYGNRYANGYLERDWTGVGVSLKFDFIIIHESGHEWFGNADLRRRRVGHVDPGRLVQLPGVHLRRGAVRPRGCASSTRTATSRRSATASRSSRSAASIARRTRTCISRARCSWTRCATPSTTTRGGGSWFATPTRSSSTRTS